MSQPQVRHTFADGKYTVINDNGVLTALRHGEPWDRDLVGDNLVYWMLVEIDRLKTQRAELLAALRMLVDRDLRFSDRWLDTGLITREEVSRARLAILKATGEQA